MNEQILETFFCSNKNCDKRHCARHKYRNQDFAPSKDFNTTGEFLCAGYLAPFSEACKLMVNKRRKYFH